MPANGGAENVKKWGRRHARCCGLNFADLVIRLGRSSNTPT